MSTQLNALWFVGSAAWLPPPPYPSSARVCQTLTVTHGDRPKLRIGRSYRAKHRVQLQPRTLASLFSLPARACPSGAGRPGSGGRAGPRSHQLHYESGAQKIKQKVCERLSCPVIHETLAVEKCMPARACPSGAGRPGFGGRAGPRSPAAGSCALPGLRCLRKHIATQSYCRTLLRLLLGLVLCQGCVACAGTLLLTHMAKHC